eukprot:2997444-Amphidinium_carterae.1
MPRMQGMKRGRTPVPGIAMHPAQAGPHLSALELRCIQLKRQSHASGHAGGPGGSKRKIC